MADQKHPREKGDREIVHRLLKSEPNNQNYVELARLCIRYHNFPGAREIQKNLSLILENWGLTQENLYQKTRQLHASGQAYSNRSQGTDQEDWS